jgi:hypothetical protein
MDFTFTDRGASIPVTGVDEPGAVFAPMFRSQTAHIKDALRRIPTPHLRAVPTIVVGDRPASGGGFAPAAHEIRLNRRTFVASHNARYLFTLVHEIGHAVDHLLHITTRFVSETHRAGAEWSAYRAIVYRGTNVFPPDHPEAGTPRYGEHFAEGYGHLLTRPAALTETQRILIRRLAGL